MPAREWASLGEGDVVALGRRVGEAVTLRVGGVPVARGDLVEIEGEVGVRIVERLGGDGGGDEEGRSRPRRRELSASPAASRRPRRPRRARPARPPVASSSAAPSALSAAPCGQRRRRVFVARDVQERGVDARRSRRTGRRCTGPTRSRPMGVGDGTLTLAVDGATGRVTGARRGAARPGDHRRRRRRREARGERCGARTRRTTASRARCSGR